MAHSKREAHVDLIAKWINENPPGVGNGWEPYPISLRIVNWIKWVLNNNCLSNNALNSLATQTRYLSKKLEYHLLGNHLFANAKALVFSGLFFEGPEAERWLKKGLQILNKQILEQILPDGGHFELSPMYHSIILEDLLDLINLMRVYEFELPRNWPNIVDKMLIWLTIVCHPDGRLSFFNDTTFGIAQELKNIKKYVHDLGISVSDVPKLNITNLKESGYIRLQKDRAVLIADTGRVGPDYLPGHAHADTLSFELSLYDQNINRSQRIFVNSGISCYGNSNTRIIQRGTASHNTLVIDNEDSSEVWGGFRVAKRAYPKGFEIVNGSQGELVLKCGHDGYERLKGKPVHWREWHLTGDSFEIRDLITGGFANATAFYHLYPGIDVDLEKKIIRSDQLNIFFETDAEISLKQTFFYPEFGKAIPNKCLSAKPIGDKYFIKFFVH